VNAYVQKAAEYQSVQKERDNVKKVQRSGSALEISRGGVIIRWNSRVALVTLGTSPTEKQKRRQPAALWMSGTF